jgi:uncharacterized Zn finger protein
VTALPPLTDSKIQRWIGGASFRRGERYYRVLEGEIDRALETLERYSQQHRWGRNTLALRVAEAAEESRPRDAIRLYLEEVERLIAGRGRGSYAEAANYLLRVRAVYEQIGEEKAWQTLIANLREKNRRLPAMQDEFNQAGL